ncbi:MAG: zinc ribbon domain-containing protein [Clostridiales bacterium]|nr:zinc ribbon domain-containing protein [Clostridiales bacterium]
MNCGKCNFEVPSGGVFCPNCGARVDGKKECSNCKSLIDENAVYCTFCGARVDGKKTCANCGEEINGKFCVKCGAKNNEKEQGLAKSKTRDGFAVYSKVVNIISPSLSICVLLLTFVFSFFIGLTSTSEEAEIKIDCFYFFSKAFRESKVLINSAVPEQMKKTALFVVNAENIICLIAIIVNFIIQAIATTIGIINSINKIANKKTTKNYCAFISFISLIVTTLIVYTMQNMYYLNYVYWFVSEMKVSTTVVVGICISAILLLIDVILTAIEKQYGKNIEDILKKSLPLSIGLVAWIITLVFINTKTFESTSGYFSAGSFAKNFTLFIAGGDVPNRNLILIFSQISIFVNVICSLVFAYSVYRNIQHICSDKACKKELWFSNIVSVVITTIFFVFVVVIRVLAETAGIKNLYLGSGIIVALITAVLAFISSIVYKAINK